MVLFSHSWPLTTGSNVHEPLALATRCQLDFGSLAVDVFFIVSGFLVTRSFDKSRSAVSFSKSRALRIVPGLLVVILLLAFVLGPLATADTSIKYWSAIPFPSLIADHLPGVFAHVPYPYAVDGSLWTIKYEVLCYVMVALFGMVSVLTNRYAMSALFLFSLTPFANHYSLGLLPFFSVGMLFYAFRKWIRISSLYALISLAVSIGSIVFDVSHWVLPITLGYLVLCFAYSPRVQLHRFARYGDWSYGIYIYAFPVQQLLASYAGVRSPLTLFAMSLPITLVFAALSWHLVEKRALAFKHVTFRSAAKVPIETLRD